ncbi:FtsX-like permease family protein [Flavobacterium sp. NST-5]|uniref:FtsX-like permease family protein n=1 Tax=Flavobacterium ichthyis TaxID=2698827 RepID=A0ABW9ZB52_9FLAO|nr:ABC transporter permease [Flavobacterium ichthyis]NBL65926.1 FtsX-like permease family protein [Flavobacterium ichthyis]
MIKNWARLFIHHFKNHKIFAILNILGLGIGIAGIIFAILYWNDEHSYESWNPDKDKVYVSVSTIADEFVWASNVSGFVPYFEKNFPEIESYCYFENWYDENVLQSGNKRTIAKVIAAQKDFFEMFPFPFTHGNSKTALQDENSVALREDLAKAFFGEKNPLGKTILFRDKNYLIRGVYKIPGNTMLKPQVVINNMEKRLTDDVNNWGNFNYGLLIKLKNTEQKQAVEQKMTQIVFENRDVKRAKAEGVSIEEWKKRKENQFSIKLQPLSQLRLDSSVEALPEHAGNYQFLMIMVGISVLILILSIVNYINLATANAVKRAKEVGVRKIFGATKSNIVSQFLFETAIITGIAIFFALLLVELTLPYYNDFLGKNLVIEGSQFYGQLVLIFVVVIVLAGMLPAIYVANFQTIKVLKGNYSRSKKGTFTRNFMLVLQFAIATFFMVGSYIVYQQIDFVMKKDLGFNGEQILQIVYNNNYDYLIDPDFEKTVAQKYFSTKEQLLQIDGVKTVSAGSFSFGNNVGASSSFEYGVHSVQSKNMLIDFGMLEMMKIKIKEGRYFSSQFALDTVSSVILNETAVRLMKEKNPIGKEIRWNDKMLKIVGVVKDFHINGPQEEIPPMTFFHPKTIPWMILNANTIYLEVEAGKIEEVLAKTETLWKTKVDPEFPFQYDFADKSFARSYQNYVYQRNLFSLLNIVVILIALFGLFAISSYSIQRRMKEIAIRKTLGAETKSLLQNLSKQYIWFCVTGFIIAVIPVYILLNKWLENFVYRIEISVVPFVLGFLILMIATLFVVLSNAFNATKVNVLQYLKYE